jgi:hypothetical protein
MRKILCNYCASPLSAGNKISESSSNNKCDTLGALEQTLTPFNLPSSSAFCSSDENPYAHIRNK